ncbi:Uncharacterised protein [Legionella busanensis]|uniref:Uncharacterized protein n=2 Tax=Legionella busanensis TaxID=190655 RepID=A0A378JI84_9GAMM|nr:Uncharacterised protein [Legionella busanensis]
MPNQYVDITKHVKVWFAGDPDEPFGFIDNELRLIRHCETNPKHTIYFVYDESKLSEKGKSKLYSFIKKYPSIKLVELKEIESNLKTHQERQLMKLVKEELHQKYGNLAAAKDILTTLSPIYELGIYTDFDAEIDFRQFNQITMLLKNGLIPFAVPDDRQGRSYIEINCWLLYFPNFEDPILLNIQEDIIQQYNDEIVDLPDEILDELYFCAAQIGISLPNFISQSIWELREKLFTFCDVLAEAIDSHRHYKSWGEYGVTKDDLEEIKHQFIKNNIESLTGPRAWLRAIQKMVSLDYPKEDIAKYVDYIYDQYKAIYRDISLFSHPLRKGIKGMKIPIDNYDGEWLRSNKHLEKNDLSWTEQGKRVLLANKVKLKHSVNVIASFWKKLSPDHTNINSSKKSEENELDNKINNLRIN